MANIPESWMWGIETPDTRDYGDANITISLCISPLPGSLFRSSPKLLHRASGPACRYAGHKSIPSSFQYLSSPPSLPSLRCRMLLFWGEMGKLYTKKVIREAVRYLYYTQCLYWTCETVRGHKTLEIYIAFSFQTESAKSWRFTTSRVFSLYSAAVLMSMARVEIHPLGGQISEFRAVLGLL